MLVGTGDANTFIPKVCDRIVKENTRAVLFLDPFGTQVNFETIECIAQTKKIDLWVLFPWYAVNRSLPRDPNKKDSNKSALDRVFGNDSWKEVYKLKENLFGEYEEKDHKRISNIYLERFKNSFSEGWRPRRNINFA